MEKVTSLKFRPKLAEKSLLFCHAAVNALKIDEVVLQLTVKFWKNEEMPEGTFSQYHLESLQ